MKHGHILNGKGIMGMRLREIVSRRLGGKWGESDRLTETGNGKLERWSVKCKPGV
jgi:hypothetical protein